MFRRGLLLGAITALLALWMPTWYIERRFASSIHPLESAPAAEVAIVFGAGLRRDGRPTAVLHDRVMAAVQLFLGGKAELLLMSGTQSGTSYDEPEAMRQLAIESGVPAAAIQVDGGGTRTFTTCQRAMQQFGIERALLVSQRYHLPRALAICAGLGLQADGVEADLRRYSTRTYRFWETREIPAMVVALLELAVAGLSQS